MGSTRQNKVARLLQKELSNIFLNLTREYFQGKMLSVTVVRITQDFSEAKVYLSIFPDNNAEEILEQINLKNKLIRHKLSQTIKKQLRRTPDLQFYIDDSLEYAKKIEKLLDDKN